jgi:hypothetical protein
VKPRQLKLLALKQPAHVLRVIDWDTGHRMSNELGRQHEVGVRDEEVVRVLEVRAERGAQQTAPEFPLELNFRVAMAGFVQVAQIRQIENRSR